MFGVSEKIKHFLFAYLKVSTPILLSNSNTILMAIIDNKMVGGVGELARDTAGQVNVLCSVPNFFLLGFSTILAPFIAGSQSRLDYLEASKAFKYVWLTTSGLGLLLTLGGLAGMDLLDYVVRSRDVVLLAKSGYFQYTFLSICTAACVQPIKRYLDGVGLRSLNTGVNFINTLLKIFLNYHWIYGHWGGTAMGLKGAGLATFVSNLFTMGLYFAVMVWLYRRSLFFLSPFSKFHPQVYKNMMRLGVPVGLGFAARMVNITILGLMAGALGRNASAARTICVDLIRLETLLPIALGTAASILVGALWKRKEALDIALVARIGYTIGGATLVLLAIVGYFCFPYALQHYYKAAPGVEQEALNVFPIVLLMGIADGLNIIGAGVLRGMRDTAFSLVAGCLSYALLAIPIGYILAFYCQLGIGGLLVGNLVGTTALAIATFWRYAFRLRQLRKKRS